MKDFIRWAAVIPLFIIPFIPLYVASGMFFPYIVGKGFAFRILIGISAAAWVLLVIADRRYRPKRSWTLLIYGALVLWMFVADLFAVNAHKAFWSNYERMDGFVTLAHAFVFFVVAGSVLTVGNLWKRWWLTVLAASAFVAVHGVLQLAGMAQIHQGGVRLDANFGNSAYLAAYLLFMIAVALWQALGAKGWLRYGLFALSVIHVVLLFSTATRGAILAFVGAVVLGALLWLFQSGKQGMKVGVGILAGTALLIGGFLMVRDAQFIKNDPIFSRIASISLADGSTRFTLWGMAGKGIMERPVFGWGHEGYSYIFNEYYEPSLYAQEPWFDRAHNVFIDWAVYGGIPAFLLFIALLASGVLALWRSALPRAERTLLICAVAAYSFQALFVFDNLLSYIMLAAILAVAHASAARPFAKLDALPEASEDMLATRALPAVLALGAGIIWIVNVPGIVGGQTLIKALTSRQDAGKALPLFEEALASGTFATQEVREQFVTYAAAVAGATTLPQEFRVAMLDRALAEIKQELDRVPEDVRIRIMYSQGFEAKGDLATALTELDTARAYSPKKQLLLLQLGMLSWKSNDRVRAAGYFSEAYELDTRNDMAALYAAAGQIITGKTTEGLALLTDTYGTTTVNDDIARFAFIEAKLYPELIASAELRTRELGGSADARLYLARVYATAGQFARARAEIAATIAAFPQAKAAGEELLRQLP